MLIALFVFLSLLSLSLLRVSCILNYDSDGFSGSIRFLFFKFTVPPKTKNRDNQKKETPKSKDKPGDLNVFKSMLSPIFETFGKLVRMLTVDFLNADIRIGNSDAFNAAITYGATCAGIGVLFPFIDSNLKIKKRQISVVADFENAESTIIMHTKLHLCLWQIATIAIYFLYLYIKNLKGSEKNGRTCT